MGSQSSIHRRDLVGLLRASVGEEKASALIFDAAIKLGFGTFDYSEAQAVAILAEIAREPGLVGIAAGLAKTRVPRLMKQSES